MKYYVLARNRWHKARRHWDGRVIFENITYGVDSVFVKVKD
jgi:hypothetical protein